MDGRIRVGRAHVIKPDLIAANGVVHIIESVILTPEVAWVGMHNGPVLIARSSNSPADMTPV